MKSGKLIGIIIVVLVILIVVAYFVGKNNVNKTQSAIANAPAANPAVTGTRVAMIASNNLVGKWKKVDNSSTGACPAGTVSGEALGEKPIGENNGNPVYNCYVSTGSSN